MKRRDFLKAGAALAGAAALPAVAAIPAAPSGMAMMMESAPPRAFFNGYFFMSQAGLIHVSGVNDRTRWDTVTYEGPG